MAIDAELKTLIADRLRIDAHIRDLESERASLVGAQLDIESTPGQGTTILVRMAVPVASTE